MERSPWNISYFFPKLGLGVLGGNSFFSARFSPAVKAAVLHPPHFYCWSPRTQNNPAQTKETGVENIYLRVGVAPRVGPDSFHFFLLPGDALWTGPAQHLLGQSAPRHGGETLRGFVCVLGGSPQEGGGLSPCSGEPAPASLFFHPGGDQMTQIRALPRQPQRVTLPFGLPGKRGQARVLVPRRAPCVPQGTFPTSAFSWGQPGHGWPRGAEGSPRGAGLVPGVCPGPCPSGGSRGSRLLPVAGGSPHPRRGGGGERCPARSAGAAERGGARMLRTHPAPAWPAAAVNPIHVPTGHAAPRCIPGRRTGSPGGCATCAAGPPRPLRAPGTAPAGSARSCCPGTAVPLGGGGSRGRGSAQRRKPGQLCSPRRSPSLPVMF